VDEHAPETALLECPSWELLLDFDLGRLADHDLEAVAEHLSSCPRCVESLRAVHEESTEDSLVARLRQCLAGPPPPGVPAPDPRDDLAPTISASRASPDAGADLAVGRTIGDYQVVRRIGHGGMGVVYVAHQTALDRPVALKMILAGHHVTAAEKT
jgi:serine/threonine protein kinase